MEDSAALSQEAIIQLRDEVRRKVAVETGLRQQLAEVEQHSRELREQLSEERTSREQAVARAESLGKEAGHLGKELASKLEQLHVEFDGEVDRKHQTITELQESLANATRIGIVQHSGVAEDNVQAELASRYPSDLAVPTIHFIKKILCVPG